MEENTKQSELDYLRDLLQKQQYLLEKRNRLLEDWKSLIYQQKDLLTNTPILQERFQNQQFA